MPILTGLGALYAPFDLEAGSDGFNTGFAFPEVMQALVEAARAQDWPRVHQIYARFAALIVFEQQPGVAIRKELLRRRGLFASPRACRHPGATISAAQSQQLDALLERTLPGVDITRPIRDRTTGSSLKQEESAAMEPTSTSASRTRPPNHAAAAAVPVRAVHLQLRGPRQRRLRRAADEGRPRLLERGVRLRRRHLLHRLLSAAGARDAADRAVERARLHRREPDRLGRARGAHAGSSTPPASSTGCVSSWASRRPGSSPASSWT